MAFTWLVVLLIASTPAVKPANIGDKIELAFDGVKWHAFAGALRAAKLEQFDDAYCISFAYWTGVSRVCSVKGEPIWVRCTEGIFSARDCGVIGLRKNSFSPWCKLKAFLGKCHPRVSYEVASNLLEGPMGSDVAGFSSTSLEQHVKLISEKYSEAYKTTIIFFQDEGDGEHSNQQLARIEIFGQGTEHGKATSCVLYRFDDQVDIQLLLLVATHNVLQYQHNRDLYWFKDIITHVAKSLLKESVGKFLVGLK